MSRELRIECQCEGCGGTGVYSGMCEPKGVAVVCIGCGGKGKAYVYYKPFTERKIRKGIQTVRRSRGSFIGTGVGPIGKEITYKDFLKGEMPKNG